MSCGSGGEGRKGNLSREFFLGPTFSLPPAGDGPLGLKGISGLSKNFGGDG